MTAAENCPPPEGPNLAVAGTVAGDRLSVASRGGEA
jgi:hypothetical protein